MMSGPIHPTSIHWIIIFRGNAGVSRKAETEAKTSSRILKCTLVYLVCVTGESHIAHSVKDYHKRLQICVSASGGHFEHVMS